MTLDLEIVRGTTNSFGIDLKDADGNDYALEAGQALAFALKKRPKDEDRVLVKKITNVVDGMYYLELEPADTHDLAPGRYYYDIGLQQGETTFYNVIEASMFTIKPNISKLGDCS